MKRLVVPAFASLAAILLVSCGEERTVPSGAVTTPSGAEAAYRHTSAIVALGPRPPGSPALAKARSYVTTQLQAAGWQVAKQTIPGNGPNGPVTFVNLLARFGDGTSPTFWSAPVDGLLAAHLDSKYYRTQRFVGADDAASAVGVVLELARQLATTPELAGRLELVLFDGEEAFATNINIDRPPFDGLYGSRAYAKRWRSKPDKPGFGIVLDMVGHEDLQISYPADSPPRLAKALQLAAAEEGVADRFKPNDLPIIDDHVPLNNAGIPTIDIIGEFTNDWWHTEADNLDLISRESLGITLAVTHRLIRDLLREH